MKTKTRALLSKVYYDPSHPASFSTVNKLWEAVKKKVPKSEVLQWLQAQDAYTLHKTVKKRFKRNKFYVDNIDDLWQADLNDMQSLKKYNDGYNYLLTVIDVFSKHAWVRPLRKKTGTDVSKAFENIFQESKRKPVHLETDKGREFLNKPFQEFLKSNNVGFYHSNNPDIKASIVERFNRTLKTKMWRLFTSKSTYQYLDQLPLLIQGYNSSFHRSIGMAPRQVNASNVLQVWNNLYNRSNILPIAKPKFVIGDSVRITREKMIFLKGYESNWSEELFRITKVIRRHPIVYTIADWNGEMIEGTFYEHELQRVRVGENTLFKIDKILESRGSGTRREVKVKWRGYPDSYNSWIAASQVRSLV